MMSLVQLHELDEALRKSTNLPLVFGGITIVLSGDFYQMPPVGNSMMYLRPTIKDGAPDASLAGYKLWEKFTDVIYLDENNRFIKDPDWGIGCYYARKGVWLDSFVKRINKYIFTPIYKQVSISEDNSNNCRDFIERVKDTNSSPQFVSPDNLLRHLINQQFSSLVSYTESQSEKPTFPIRIVGQFSPNLSKLSINEKINIMSTLDNKLGRLSPYIDFIIGMPITITQNINTSLGICNGTFGKAIDIQFPVDTRFREIVDANTNTIVLIPDKPPDVIIVLIQNGRYCSYLPGVYT